MYKDLENELFSYIYIYIYIEREREREIIALHALARSVRLGVFCN